MDPDRSELTMTVEDMSCEGCSEAVRRTIRRLDPQAEVSVDLATGRITALTRAPSRDIAQALDKAGYAATATIG